MKIRQRKELLLFPHETPKKRRRGFCIFFMNSVNVFNITRKEPVFPPEEIKKTAETAFAFFKEGDFFLDIYLVDNKEIRRLNKKFRGKDKDTNVLSFKEPEKFPHPEIIEKKNKKFSGKFKHLGEIYLAPEYIKKHNEDISRLLLHGILHLFGYTHSGKNDTIKMTKWENEIMKCLHFPE